MRLRFAKLSSLVVTVLLSQRRLLLSGVKKVPKELEDWLGLEEVFENTEMYLEFLFGFGDFGVGDPMYRFRLDEDGVVIVPSNPMLLQLLSGDHHETDEATVLGVVATDW